MMKSNRLNTHKDTLVNHNNKHNQFESLTKNTLNKLFKCGLQIGVRTVSSDPTGQVKRRTGGSGKPKKNVPKISAITQESPTENGA